MEAECAEKVRLLFDEKLARLEKVLNKPRGTCRGLNFPGCKEGPQYGDGGNKGGTCSNALNGHGEPQPRDLAIIV